VIFFVGCSATKGAEREMGSLSSEEAEPYVKGYYPSSQELDYQNVLHANKDNWCSVVKNAPEKTTILLEDGEYTDYCALKNKRYITIKAENKYGVTYTGDNFFLTLQDKNHHINLIGIEATTTTDTFNSGLLKVHGYADYDNHHIYVADCWIHHSGSGILTSPRNHDITVDRCLIHDIKMGYYWYAMGWHLTLSNSVLYHPENNGMVIRGHFPLNRYWDFEEAKTADVTKEEGLENIAEDDWTHYVVGNFFGEGYGRNAQRSWERGSAISFYIGRENHDEDDAYLAPQNVVIEDNLFYNITPSIAPTGEVFAGAITIDGEAGFSFTKTDAIDGLITGTILKNNTSNVPLLKPFWNPDLSLITEKNNKSWDSRVLEQEFHKRVEALQSNTY
jgi:hypothetical protein